MHYYAATEELPRHGQVVAFLCGDSGVLDYAGVGQHRPIPSEGAIARMPDDGACRLCTLATVDTPGRLGAHLPAEPLLRWLRKHSIRSQTGDGTAENRAVWRAIADGWVTLRQADHIACTVLGMHPAEVWGDEFFGILA